MKKFEFQKKNERGSDDSQEKEPEKDREDGKRFDQKKS